MGQAIALQKAESYMVVINTHFIATNSYGWPNTSTVVAYVLLRNVLIVLIADNSLDRLLSPPAHSLLITATFGLIELHHGPRVAPMQPGPSESAVYDRMAARNECVVARQTCCP